MVRDDDTNLRNVLNQIVYNELSLQRNPTNFTVLGAIFPAYPIARTALADIFIELLQKREDFLAALKQMLREIARNCRPDCSLVLFVAGLVSVYNRVRGKSNFQLLEAEGFLNFNVMLDCVGVPLARGRVSGKNF
jgi:hypothetical protein